MSSTTNIYKDDIDFAHLALQDGEFANVLKPNGQLDFSNPESVLQLTKSLLKRDFGLQITLPPDRLCPPVPNRLNYILWIQALLDTTSDSYTDTYNPGRQILGLDIGTGASCIYPLLGCSQRPNWRFAATDIDTKSLQFARQNVQTNNLQTRIKLLQTQPEGPLIPLDMLGFENIDFTITNPPFFVSESEMLSSAHAKSRPPFTACTGSRTEMIYSPLKGQPGGEIGFTSRIITESLQLRDRVQWYTTLLGKLSSLAPLIHVLREHGISNYAVTEFVQGSKTRRWGLAWSFGAFRPRMSVARGLGGSAGLQKALFPFPVEYGVLIADTKMESAGGHLNEVLKALELRWMWKANTSMGLGFSERNVWSRASRRRDRGVKETDAPDDDDDDDDDDDEKEMAFGFKIYLKQVTGEQSGVQMTIRWIKGRDSVLFESFCGMLKRKMEMEMSS